MKNKNLLIFLGSTLIFSFVGFGSLYFLGYTFDQVISTPLGIIIFVLSGLVPGLIGMKLTGFKIKEDLSKTKSLSMMFLVAFILLNFMLFGLFGKISPIENIFYVLLAIIICIFTFGLQEVGWIEIVYKHFKPIRSTFKAMAVVGLFKSITLLPLLFLEGFPLLAYSYAFFAVYLIGSSSQSVFLSEYSGSNTLAIIFTGILYGFLSIMDVNLEGRLIVIGLILGIIVYSLQDLMTGTKTRK